MARWFLPNTGFELGVRDWDTAPEWSIVNDAVNARSGSWVGRFIGADDSRSVLLPEIPVRPAATIDASIWIKGGTEGVGAVRVFWIDHAGVSFNSDFGNLLPAAGAYAQSTAVFTAPDRAKTVRLGVVLSTFASLLQGTWFVDDMEASGDIIETIPTSAIIREKRITPADTVSAFDPLVGETKFSEFNAGMSDRWSGLYTFLPALGADLGELAAFIQRIGKRDRFFADDPDHQTPVNGVVNDMVVDGAVTQGTTRIPVRGGPVSTTALVFGDYVEIGAQYFKVMRPLEIGPEGTGNLIVWPSVRAALADGEDLITDHPKMVARRTSEFDLRRFEAHPEGPISMSWIEY